MHLDTIKKKGPNGEVWKSYLLRETYREDGKVKKRTVANLKGCSEEEIHALRLALNSKKNPQALFNNDQQLQQGKSIGAVWGLYELAKKIGLTEVLGSSFEGKLALWLTIVRTLQQGSRLSAVRLNRSHALAEVIRPNKRVSEDHMYNTLQWLSSRQNEIEKGLFKRHRNPEGFFWFDVTSSYFEGSHNHYAAFGYNRDGKKRKRTVVIGLLCSSKGDPVSIEAFPGNTQDSETLVRQVDKLTKRFECSDITLVGDRGMIRPKQIKEIEERGFSYISALTTPQVRSLIASEILSLDEFSDQLNSLHHKKTRYIYRRNPERAKETIADRTERYGVAERKVREENERLLASPKAGIEAAKKRLQGWLAKLCLKDWVLLRRRNRTFYLEIQQKGLEEKARLDGCYVWTTNVDDTVLSDDEVYRKYKELNYVESAFRRMKTTHLEVRPLYVRSEASTCGHFIVTMLAYLLFRRLEEAWAPFDITVQEGLDMLSTHSYLRLGKGEASKYIVPKPSSEIDKLLKAIEVTLPDSISEAPEDVDTRKKISLDLK